MNRRQIASLIVVGGVGWMFLMYVIPSTEATGRILAKLGLVGWLVGFCAAIFLLVDWLREKLFNRGR